MDERSGVLALQVAGCLQRHQDLHAVVSRDGALVDGEPHMLIGALRAEQRFLALARQLHFDA